MPTFLPPSAAVSEVGRTRQAELDANKAVEVLAKGLKGYTVVI